MYDNTVPRSFYFVVFVGGVFCLSGGSKWHGIAEAISDVINNTENNIPLTDIVYSYLGIIYHYGRPKNRAGSLLISF